MKLVGLEYYIRIMEELEKIVENDNSCNVYNPTFVLSFESAEKMLRSPLFLEYPYHLCISMNYKSSKLESLELDVILQDKNEVEKIKSGWLYYYFREYRNKILEDSGYVEKFSSIEMTVFFNYDDVDFYGVGKGCNLHVNNSFSVARDVLMKSEGKVLDFINSLDVKKRNLFIHFVLMTNLERAFELYKGRVGVLNLQLPVKCFKMVYNFFNRFVSDSEEDWDYSRLLENFGVYLQLVKDKLLEDRKEK